MGAGTLVMNRANVSGGWRITSNDAPQVKIHKRASAANVLTNALFTDVSFVFNTFSSIAWTPFQKFGNVSFSGIFASHPSAVTSVT